MQYPGEPNPTLASRRDRKLYHYPISLRDRAVEVNRYRIPVPNLPPAFHGFTIVQLSDLHLGMFVSADFIRSVIATANSIPRDLTICTGDYILKRKASLIDRIWPLLSGLHAPHGVLTILGNHDHWGDTERSVYWLEKSGQNLRHKVRVIEKLGERLWFVGAGDLWEDHVELDALLGHIAPHECKIVLAHNPDTADTAFESRVDLMIAGHTHGGQINVPFCAPVLPVKNKTYSWGMKQSRRGLPVFISRGIGWGVLPVRFDCFPEIAVLELVKG